MQDTITSKCHQTTLYSRTSSRSLKLINIPNIKSGTKKTNAPSILDAIITISSIKKSNHSKCSEYPDANIITPK